jgi:hypothetical protein
MDISEFIGKDITNKSINGFTSIDKLMTKFVLIIAETLVVIISPIDYSGRSV